MSAREGGYTIVEVIIFLAVSSVLAVSILMSIGNTVSLQRYRDAADSFSTFIQSQYDKTVNVINDTEMHKKCETTGSNVTFSSIEVEQAGASERCMIVGRFISTADGKKFKAQPIYMVTAGDLLTVGLDEEADSGDFKFLEKASNGSGLGVDEKKALIRTVVDDNGSSTEEYLLGWDTKLDAKKPGNIVSIAIVRSPISGMIRTYYSNSTSLSNTISSTGRSKPATICVDPSGWMIGGKLGVHIAADAATASSVQVYSEGCE